MSPRPGGEEEEPLHAFTALSSRVCEQARGEGWPGPVHVSSVSPRLEPADRLVARMTSIVNAELLALASIPLTATTMSRGIGYAEWLPWQVVSSRSCPYSPSPHLSLSRDTSSDTRPPTRPYAH